jgi:hypothetical protein
VKFSDWAGMVAWIHARMDRNDDTDILIEGPTGSGKSNTSLLLVETLRPGFEFEDVYVYDAYDLARVLQRNGRAKNPIWWFDEAKNLIYRRNAMTRRNKAILEMMSQIRELNGTRIWVSPDVSELESYITGDRSQVLLTSPYRGGLTAWSFHKDYNLPPGLRSAYWKKTFTRSGLPDMSQLRPDRWAEYRQWKSRGFDRAAHRLVDTFGGQAPERAPSEGAAVAPAARPRPSNSEFLVPKVRGSWKKPHS